MHERPQAAARGSAPLVYARMTTPLQRPQAEEGKQLPEESEYVRQLPDWARKFLRQGAGSGTGASPAAMAAPASQPSSPAEKIHWTAPAYAPTAPIAYKESSAPPKSASAPAISDSDLTRAADQVYQMIEDRIRRERRRLGL